jgi:hypothetical protein
MDTRSRPALHDTFTTDMHGPCIVAQVRATTPGTCAVLTWKGLCVWLYDHELRPFPCKPGAVSDVTVPDYSVEGVSEIVDLVVDLDVEPPRRVKSKLWPLLMRVERDGDL